MSEHFTTKRLLAEAETNLCSAITNLDRDGPGGVITKVYNAINKSVRAAELLANAEAHRCRRDGYRQGMMDARDGCVCDKQPGKCPAHDIFIEKNVEALGTDE